MAGARRHLHESGAAVKDMTKITRVRGIWEKQARAALGEANRQLAEAEEAVVTALDDHRRTVADTATAPGIDNLMMKRMAGIATHERYTAAELVRGHAEARSRAAHGSWRRSAQELEVASKLEERRKQALAYLARRSAEASLDELMALRRERRR
jgi:hypothetical protein